MSAPTVEVSAAAESTPAVDTWTRIRTVARVTGSKIAHGLSLAWGSFLVVVMILRMGVVWTEFCIRTGIAHREKVPRPFLRQKLLGLDDTMQVVRDVPKLRAWKAGPYGARVRLKLRPAQDLSDVDGRMRALRHSLRIQSAKVSELPNKPGFLQLDLLRRDPLNQVRHGPKPISAGVYQLGATEEGRSFQVDLNRFPHNLAIGATGSGKSGFIRAFGSAVAPTDDLIVAWDLKWALEASVMAPRMSAICDTREHVAWSAQEVIALAGDRAERFKAVGATNITEYEEITGVHLRRVHVWVDEVAEIALATPDPTNSDKAKAAKAATAERDEVLNQVLRIVQLVRFAGIHVMVAGQRLGSDMGNLITTIRSQLAGRLVLSVNDKQTAEMGLPGMNPELHEKAMRLNRPGLVIQKGKGDQWSLNRSAQVSVSAARAIASQHASQAIPLEQVRADDEHRAGYLVTNEERR